MSKPLQTPPVRAFIALGANLEDPASQVRAGAAALDRLPETRLLRLSSLYRTAPVGVSGQPDYVNAVAEIETKLDPEALLAALLATESDFGRQRDFQLAPRTLDLDLLLYGNSIIDSPTLTLPHPRMHLRAFVIVPLVEIAPGCLIPGRGEAASWLPALRLQRIEIYPE